MTDTQPKILLLGDYSNCHNTLAAGLRALGCRVTVASDGSRWQNVHRDIDLRRAPGTAGAVRYAAGVFAKLAFGSLGGFDIVAVHDPHFADLRPGRLKPLYRLLRRRNGRIFYTAMSNDIPYLDMLCAPDPPLAYSEWHRSTPAGTVHAHAGKERIAAWRDPAIRRWQDWFFDNIDGAVSVLYEYHLAMQRRLGDGLCAYGGLPVDTDRFAPSPGRGAMGWDGNGPVRLFLGRDPRRTDLKGSLVLEDAARAAMARHPGAATLQIVQNVTFDRFTGLLRDAHVVLDQIYSYTPATTALMAMACGQNTVSGGEADFYDFIGEHDNRPVINAPIDAGALTDVIADVIAHPADIKTRGQQSRQFAVRHNDAVTVAKRFLDFWTK